MGESSLGAKCLAEFVGTFLLVLAVGCNVLHGSAAWSGVSIGSVYMVAIYALGGISGANLNPAVSLALGLSKALGGPGLDMRTVGIYAGVQTAAGIAGALCYVAVFWSPWGLAPANGFGAFEAGLCELLYTFMLCFVVLNVAVAGNNSPNQHYGLSIGFVLVAGVYGAGAISRGFFNPAVAIGADVSNLFVGFGWCIWYVCCQVAGSALAALLFKLVRPEDFGQEERRGTSELLAEFIGTFMLVLTVGLNVLGKSGARAYSIAAAYMCMIYALGDVSGGHFNPAVTVAVLASKRVPDLTYKKASKYVATQLAAGLLAAFTYSLIYRGGSFGLQPSLGGKTTWTQVAAAELVFTSALCFAALGVTVSNKTKQATMFGLAVGACVTVGGTAVGAVSGGALNPAVALGIAVPHALKGGGVSKAAFYALFELLGGVLAALVFALTHAVDMEEKLLV